MLGNLIGGFITIVVGVSLIGPVADQVAISLNNVDFNASSNVTGAAATVVNLVTLFYALGVMSAGVAITVGGLRSAGIM